MTSRPEILTIGHSTHDVEQFLALLAQHCVTAIADVRSQPFSRYSPQYNRSALSASLKRHGIRYVFLGEALGARSTDPDCYVDGRVQYERLARSEAFEAGVTRVLNGAQHERISLMCTEKEPLDCHRTVLVARHLEARGASVSHIHADGSTESHDQAMDRLLQQLGMQASLLCSRDAQIEEALTKQESRIAYVDPDLQASSTTAVP